MRSTSTVILSILFMFGLTGHSSGQQPFSESFAAAEMRRALLDPDTKVSIRVVASQQAVFDALLKQVDQYSEDAVAVTFDHSGSNTTNNIGVGSIRITEMKNGNLLYQRIIHFDEPNSFAYYTDMTLSTVGVPLNYTVGHYSVSRNNENSVDATVSVAYEPSSRLTGFAIRRLFNRAVRQDFAKAEAYLNGGNVSQ